MSTKKYRLSDPPKVPKNVPCTKCSRWITHHCDVCDNGDIPFAAVITSELKKLKHK